MERKEFIEKAVLAMLSNPEIIRGSDLGDIETMRSLEFAAKRLANILEIKY